MKTCWLNENGEQDERGTIPDGVKLSEHEANILMKLAGQLTHNDKLRMGFTEEECTIIGNWFHGI